MQELVKKINAVMHDLGAVEKNGKNQFQNYKYMAHADLMKQLHPLLIKHGLVIYPGDAKVQTSTSEDVKNGEKVSHQNRIVIETAYFITDGTDKLEFSGVGEGVDSQDKASYKAQTGAHKYALKGLFCIPDELDAENDGTGGSSIHDPEQKPEDNAAKLGNSTQKAGKERALKVKEYFEANLIFESEIASLKTKFKVNAVADAPKDAVEALINIGLDREITSNEKRKAK